MTYRYRHTHRPQRPRWLTLRYPATCRVCGTSVPAGETGYYDPRDRSVTCYAIACCEADGLTRQQWHGSPVSGQWVTVRAERRLRDGA